MLGKLRHYSKDEEAMAAVEMAFVAPILIIMLLGMVELTQAMLARSDVVNMASTSANLIAEDNAVTSDEFTNVFNAVNAMLFPFNITQPNPSNPSSPTPLFTITVTSIKNTSGTPLVDWSCSQNGSPEQKGRPPSVPLKDNSIAVSGTSVIWAEITYTYKSPLNYMMGNNPGTKFVSDFYVKPRRVPAGIPVTSLPPTTTASCVS